MLPRRFLVIKLIEERGGSEVGGRVFCELVLYLGETLKFYARDEKYT